MQSQTIEKPQTEPLDMAQAKAHLKVEHTAEDTLITRLITVGREHAEHFTQRAFIKQKRQVVLPKFPKNGEAILLPWPRLMSVESLNYIDTQGATQPLVETVDFVSEQLAEPVRLLPSYNVTWPSTRSQPNAVTITYYAGYGENSSDVPASIAQAILLIIGHLYSHREELSSKRLSELPFGAARLLAPFQVHYFL